MFDFDQTVGAIIAAIVAILYYYFTSTFDFWKKRNVPGPRPIPGFGNIKDVMLRKISLGSLLAKLYVEYKNEPMIGIYVRSSPTLVLCDLDLIKEVLIRDFSTFDDRGNVITERADPLSPNIFNLEPTRWRPLRIKLSPVFTSGKLKEMFPLIVECSEQLEQHLEKVAEKGEPENCSEIAARFTTDVIGSCAFGINMNALSNEQSIFRRIGRKIFAPDTKMILRLLFRETMPSLYNFLGYVMPHSEVSKFVTKVISESIQYREQNNIVRPDFINMLIELKNSGTVENIEWSDTFLAAQAFVFFAAGFETSSTTIAHALYEMALNPEIQDKLREELREFSAKNNGCLKYEDIKEMKYLDKVFKETLRKYPPGTQLRRKCNTNYTFKNTKVSIPKGTAVFIPLYAIHKDPNIYPNPEVFNPERFSEEAVAARHPMAYLPFGDGPRNCIGARFAIYQTKVGLIKMLQNFKVDVCEKTLIPYECNPIAFTLSPKGGIHLKISKVNTIET
ncbi:Cytochrome P450 6a2 [Habropoda laboriosa]|uniref:Cytochrome P450 6a2 n=1 Tax=Habropoda laboriosa TaxID=597456 RepID=A0A0L7QP16_9HYME|nr:PREDICTED: cytochrome P450 6a2-like [Habropoda laboriosa]KOC60363.1 Cytochrome P450 6a2 [Habropoda laboriosa]